MEAVSQRIAIYTTITTTTTAGAAAASAASPLNVAWQRFNPFRQCSSVVLFIPSCFYQRSKPTIFLPLCRKRRDCVALSHSPSQVSFSSRLLSRSHSMFFFFFIFSSSHSSLKSPHIVFIQIYISMQRCRGSPASILLQPIMRQLEILVLLGDISHRHSTPAICSGHFSSSHSHTNPFISNIYI